MDFKMKNFELNEENLPIIEEFSEHLPGGFFIYKADSSEELIFFNHLMVEYFGCDSNEDFKRVTFNSFKGIVHPEDYEEVETIIRMQITDDERNLDHVKYRIIRKDGSLGWFNDYGHFSHTEKYGDVFYVFVEDFTEQQRILDSELLGSSSVAVENDGGLQQNDGNKKKSLEGTTILLVDDDDLTREINKDILEFEGAHVVEADTGIQAVKLYRKNPGFDAIIMDLVMPIMDGIIATREIRFIEKSTNNHVPIVILTAAASDTQVEECLNAGANDCLNKPLVVSELSRILLACMKEYSQKIEKKLADTIRIANTDSLTKVKNIAAYTDKVADISSKMSAAGPALQYAVVMCDVNNLKKVNDSFGHDVGDTYIKNCCKIICDIFDHSPVYRIGGDEFVVILQNKDFNNKEELMCKLFDVISETAKIEDFKLGKADLAAGIAVYDPNLDFSFSDVVKRADIAMYKNKQDCKNHR